MTRLAIVGLGKIGLFHLSILRNLPDVQVAGLVDKNPSVRKTVRGLGVTLPFFSNVEELLSREQVDGVFACVPPAFNPAIAETLIPKGIGLFVEKPMAADLAGAKKMLTLLGGHSMPPANAVGYMVAFYPLFQKARELIRSGAIGSVAGYSGSLLLGEVFQKQVGWRQNPRISGGGAAAVVGTHLLYLVLSLAGMPKSILAKTERLYSAVEDRARIKFTHEGFPGDVLISWSARGYPDMALGMEFRGSSGVLRVQENALALSSKDSGWKIWRPWDVSSGARAELKVQPSRDGYAPQDQDFAASLLDKKENLVSWKEGFNVQRLLEGIYRSAEAGASVPVPE